MYDAIYVRLYLCRRRNNYDCTLNIAYWTSAYPLSTSLESVVNKTEIIDSYHYKHWKID